MASSSTNCCRLCGCVRSLWTMSMRLLISKEEGIRRKQRLVLGIVVLLLVDVIWVGSSELTDFIFKNEGFDKPFFTTYFKTSSFMVYLIGFIFYEPWRIQCICCLDDDTASNVSVSAANQMGENSSLLHSPSTLVEASPDPPPLMNQSVYEEITDDEKTSNPSTLETLNNSFEGHRQVTFNSVREVRQLSDHVAVQERLARGAYHASDGHKLSLKRVAKVAVIFCLMWFGANCSYQEAIAWTTPAAVNILSSSSGLFTLILASIFQSSTADKFSVSKLLTVLMSIAGIVLVTLSDSKSKVSGISVGALFALASAFLYSCYLIMLKRKVPDQSQMDIPMFFGFVGAFNFVLLWPGLLVLNYLKWEVFELPPRLQVWGYIVLNALVGTVLSEVLWLWGCYLTSSLTATLSLSLIIPLTMIVDVFMKRVHFSWMFLLGTIPTFASFLAVSLLTHYGDWDPVLILLKKLVNSKQQLIERTLDTEQHECLINNIPEDEDCQEINREEVST